MATVDSFSPGGAAYAWGIFSHPTQGLFVAGRSDSGRRGASAWTTRRSLDGGATWASVDIAGSGYGTSLGADAAGNIYATGTAGAFWTLRKSSNGTTWTTVDNPVSGTGVAKAFAADSNGNLFTVGETDSSVGASWIVRESAGGTGSWTTVDTFQYATGHTANADGIVADGAGHIYIAGVALDAADVHHWLVRKE